jgi:hypothetical protein
MDEPGFNVSEEQGQHKPAYTPDVANDVDDIAGKIFIGGLSWQTNKSE